MELLVNDLSIYGQFPDLATFRGAIDRVMTMRQLAQQFGRELYCHRNLVNAQVTQELTMPQAIHTFGRDETRAVMLWLTRRGPFWEDSRDHGPDDYLECDGEIVTDTAVGEAAYCCLNGVRRSLVSFTPSSWEISPVSVTWVPDAGAPRNVEIINHWEVESLEAALRSAPSPLTSWGQLEQVCRTRCPNLTISTYCCEPLRGHPFVEGAAQRVLSLLVTLDRFKCCFDEQGNRTSEGHQLYQDRFTGDRAWFSDSSEREKRDYRMELTFNHPTLSDESLFCPWHGKVNTPPLRIHFSWPVRAGEPLYVVYIGPKITKR